MEIYGWGRYPKIDAEVNYPLTNEQCTSIVSNTEHLIARGLGRSYGDSSLAPHVLDTQYLDYFISFDDSTGLLSCTSGMTLDTIIQLLVPSGWFLPVTPGTRFITIGGAIASDVHGKNHHIDGSFSNYITEIQLLLGNGETVHTSPTANPDLFHATCGGMGLTGVILSATLRLKSIRSSNIIQTTIKAPDLDSILSALTENATTTYSAAWIDCLAKGKSLGRAVLKLGEHEDEGAVHLPKRKTLTVPFVMPLNLINHAAMTIFNSLYYATAPQKKTEKINLDKFFYPLDALYNWNRLYGKSGFVQYQFVLPFASGATGLRDILDRISQSAKGSFLAVLKLLGKANQNYLSFPMEGFTLALDFKQSPAVLQLLNELDEIVQNHGGRIYLTKDARMSEATFKAGYPQWKKFEEVREKYYAIGKFASVQSQRLGLK